MRRRSAIFGMACALACGPAAAQGLPPAPALRPARQPPVVEAPKNLPAAAPRSQGPLSLIAILENAPDPREPGVRRVQFREEATSRDYFARYDGGSLAATLRVRCADREFQLQSLRLYSRNNLAGEVVASLDQPSAWRTAASDPAIDRAVALACGSRPGPALRTAAAAAPAPSPPALRGSVGDTPAPRPQPAAYGGAAQVGATASEAGSREVLTRLARLEKDRLDGLSTSVSPATVDGRTVYRALVTGFPDRAAAARFCAGLASRGRGCFLRD